MLNRIYVWEWPVRLTHWFSVLSIVVLSITGIFIGSPSFHARTAFESIMAVMRFTHFIAAYVFAVCVIVRIYWWFVGNPYAKIDRFVPMTSERWHKFIDTAKFYSFLSKKLPAYVGHTGPAGLAYLVVIILFIVETLTGFALYSQSHTGTLWFLLGGWELSLFSAMTLRLVHHLIMWLILVFSILHVYMVIHNAIIETDGLLDSMITGYKQIEDKH